MTKLLTIRFRRALQYTTPSVQTVAQEAGYSRITFAKYMGERSPSVGAARALSRVLQRRAEKLMEHASRLRQAADEAAGGATD